MPGKIEMDWLLQAGRLKFQPCRLKFSTSFPLEVKQTRLKISTLQVEIFNLHLLSWGSHTFNIEFFGDMMVDSRADDFPQTLP